MSSPALRAERQLTLGYLVPWHQQLCGRELRFLHGRVLSTRACPHSKLQSNPEPVQPSRHPQRLSPLHSYSQGVATGS